jgi:hypothetical protein
MRIHLMRGVSLCAIACAFIALPVYAGSSQYLTPGGHGDDTAQLQAALSKCTNPKKPCDLRLAKGVFYTDVLLVKGFTGSITGSGESQTIIRPLAGRPLRSTSQPFFSEPTLANPYPVLMHFADGGRVSLSRFTLDFPSSMRVMPYDFYLSGETGITTALIAAILVDGERKADFEIAHVTLRGRDTGVVYGSNLMGGVRFEGQIRFNGDTDVTRKLQHGSFVAHHNTILRTGNGLSVEDTNNTFALLTNNELDTRIYPIIFTNLSASAVGAVRNIIRGELEGIFVAQTTDRPPQKRSDYLLAQNTINVNENDNNLDPDGLGYDGIGVFDFAAYETPPRGETFLANVVIWDNDVTVRDERVLAGFTVSGDGPGSVSVIGNRVYGTPRDAGVFVDLSRGTFVTRNKFTALGSDVPAVLLTETTHSCRVIQPRNDVVNLGTDNYVVSAPSPTSERARASASANTLFKAATGSMTRRFH